MQTQEPTQAQYISAVALWASLTADDYKRIPPIEKATLYVRDARIHAAVERLIDRGLI